MIMPSDTSLPKNRWEQIKHAFPIDTRPEVVAMFEGMPALPPQEKEPDWVALANRKASCRDEIFVDRSEYPTTPTEGYTPIVERERPKLKPPL